MPMFRELYPVGSRVRIIERQDLRAFAKGWQYDHKPQRSQMKFAGREATVKAVTYHLAEVLYELDDVPGVWWEECLRKPVSSE